MTTWLSASILELCNIHNLLKKKSLFTLISELLYGISIYPAF